MSAQSLILRVVAGSGDPNAPDPQHQDASGTQPNTITRAVDPTTERPDSPYIIDQYVEDATRVDN